MVNSLKIAKKQLNYDPEKSYKSKIVILKKKENIGMLKNFEGFMVYDHSRLIDFVNIASQKQKNSLAKNWVGFIISDCLPVDTTKQCIGSEGTMRSVRLKIGKICNDNLQYNSKAQKDLRTRKELEKIEQEEVAARTRLIKTRNLKKIDQEEVSTQTRLIKTRNPKNIEKESRFRESTKENPQPLKKRKKELIKEDIEMEKSNEKLNEVNIKEEKNFNELDDQNSLCGKCNCCEIIQKILNNN